MKKPEQKILHVVIDADMHKDANKIAAKDNRSLSSWIRSVITNALAEAKKMGKKS